MGQHQRPCRNLDGILKFRVEKTFKIESSCSPNTAKSMNKSCPKCHIYMTYVYFQVWWLNRFPGQPVLMLDNPFGDDFFFLICNLNLPSQKLTLFLLVLSIVIWEKRLTLNSCSQIILFWKSYEPELSLPTLH